MENQPDPRELPFQEDYDTISQITTREGTLLTGMEARQYNLDEFNRVMTEARLNRDETVYSYGRSLSTENTASASLRHQAESAEDAYAAMRACELPGTPFHWKASKALLEAYVKKNAGSIPDSLPDNFGDDGQATV